MLIQKMGKDEMASPEPSTPLSRSVSFGDSATVCSDPFASPDAGADDVGRCTAPRGHIYERLLSTDKCIQINGDITADSLASEPSCRYYSDITASGQSFQCNGNISFEAFHDLLGPSRGSG